MYHLDMTVDLPGTPDPDPWAVALALRTLVASADSGLHWSADDRAARRDRGQPRRGSGQNETLFG